MEVKDQEKITGRLCAIGRAKYHEIIVDGPGYAFIKDGFHWELDPLDQDQYGLTAEALNDCIEQLDKMGPADELKKSQHVRQHQGWFNAGIVLTSKIDPRITCVVTLVDQDYENADVNLRWYVDLNRNSPSASGSGERSVDAEELKAVERAQEMSKEVKTEAVNESVDSLFDLPFQDKSKPTKIIGESVDGWGFPITEDDVVAGHDGHVGIDALEKPAGKEGDKDREEVDGAASVKDKNTDPLGDGKNNQHVDGAGQSQVGGTDKEADVAAAKVKPGTPEQDGKVLHHVEEEKAKKEKEEKEKKAKEEAAAAAATVTETAAPKVEDVVSGVTGHVGVDAIEKPHSKEGDKDREEVDGQGKVKVKDAVPLDKERQHVSGDGQGQVGGTDKEADVAAAKVKPGSPEQTPKVMSEEEKKKMKELRMKKYEDYKARKAAALSESKKKVEEAVDNKKPVVEEAVQHPLKVVDHLKKHMEEAHRAIKKAHHLTEWAHEKMKKSHEHLPAQHVQALMAHDAKMEAAKSHMHEAKKSMAEVCECVSGIHMGMKKK